MTGDSGKDTHLVGRLLSTACPVGHKWGLTIQLLYSTHKKETIWHEPPNNLDGLSKDSIHTILKKYIKIVTHKTKSECTNQS